ncbi:hypothetical protein [Streptodolium elevatio]|uniref:Uncharacterized protein n=1 Tax=Streptodolium elevatio TaxID=3157996 RepID=A0ABV3DE31_9ACTN
MVIENIGPTVARNVRINASPPLVDGDEALVDTNTITADRTAPAAKPAHATA